MRWWNWPDVRLAGAMPALTSGNVAGLFAYWRIRVDRDTSA